jgi:hypothetical protein
MLVCIDFTGGAIASVPDGADPAQWTRLSAVAFKDPVIDGVERGTRAEADRIAQAQREWLKRHGER